MSPTYFPRSDATLVPFCSVALSSVNGRNFVAPSPKVDALLAFFCKSCHFGDRLPYFRILAPPSRSFIRFFCLEHMLSLPSWLAHVFPLQGVTGQLSSHLIYHLFIPQSCPTHLVLGI